MNKKQYQDLDFLLRELNIVKTEYDFKNSHTEKFNIFQVMYKWHDEVKLHSRFLSVLLNPKGSHRKGDTFLNLFLKSIEDKLKIDLGKTKNLQVLPNEHQKKEYKNIDILLINRAERKALIIENKIFAQDSNKDDSGQLERYYERITDEENIPKENLFCIYLTPEGRDPSDESLGKYNDVSEINGTCLSYQNDIPKWIDECLKHTINSPFLRESILQYKQIILKMAENDLDIEHRLKIIETMSKTQENLLAAKQLVTNFGHIKWHTLHNFWAEIVDGLNKRNYEILDRPSNDTITEMTHVEISKKGQSKKHECGITFKVNDGFLIQIKNDPYDWLYWGCLEKQITSKNTLDNIKKVTEGEDSIYKYDHEWVAYRFFAEGDNTKSINLTYWSTPGTFNLIRQENRTQIIEDIFSEIDSFIKKIKTA